MRRLIIFIIVIIVTLILQFLRIFFRRVIFSPDKKHIWYPDIKYNSVNIDGIHIWHFNNFTDAPTILYCHGAAGNISHQTHVTKLCDRLGINLILFDYYGYGLSDGSPSQQNLFNSADKVCGYAMSYTTGRLIIWGESLGGAPATYLASRYKFDLLILLATFSTLHDLAQNKNWLIRWLGKSLPYITDTLSNIENIKKVKCPVILIHSEEDTLINMTHAEALLDSIDHDDKTLFKINGDHRTPHITREIISSICHRCGVNGTPNCDDIIEAIKNDE